MRRRLIETVVIDAGRAGLAISYYLSRVGLAHVELKRSSAVANASRNQRRDSFTLVTPNFQVRMPGAEPGERWFGRQRDTQEGSQ